jgi:hypothetical protein
MNVLKMTASDPNFAEWNLLLTRRMVAINAHVAWDTRWICELPEPERAALMVMLDGETVTAFEELSA